jgi:hypothetical protein
MNLQNSKTHYFIVLGFSFGNITFFDHFNVNFDINLKIHYKNI